jgi:hypothetical protein
MRNILAFLLTLAPDAVLKLVQDKRPLRARELEVFARSLLPDPIDVTARGLDENSLLGVRTALLLGQEQAAQTRLAGFYARYGITPPPGLVHGGRLTLDLPPRAPTPIDRSLPKITVIMTARNEAGRIGTAIASILAQSWSHIEFVVIDDASSDDTYAVIQRFAAADERVIPVRLDRNVGTFAAKNIGLSMAHGDLVTMMDADDWSHPLRLQRQAEPLLKNARLKGTSSKWFRIHDQTGLPYSRLIFPLLRWNPSSLMFRRTEILQNLGYYRVGLLGADAEIIGRIETRWGARAHITIDQPLACGAFRANSLTTRAVYGFDNTGWSAPRQRDWESWRRDHAAWVRGERALFVEKPEMSA